MIASASWTSVGPDGQAWPTNIDSYRGIAGIKHGKSMFLVGVFLTDAEPVDPAPARLDFTNADQFTTLSPLIGQTFLIGDGLTGTGTGSRQQFNVPATATRLFLGYADGYNFTGPPGNYSDNGGSLTVVVEVSGGASPGGNLLVNGSFEQPGGGDRLGLPRGSTHITGWVVTADTVDYQTNWFPCSDGRYCLDMDGTPGYGAVAQSFATTPGAAYTVSFDLAGNPGGPPTIKQLQVSAAGQQAMFTFDITGRSGTNMGWTAKTWSFTATAATTTLEFRSRDESGGMTGPYLDNVRVTLGGGPAACTCTLSPTGGQAPAGGGQGSVSVSAAAGCSWTATSSVAWITITSGASGTGSGAVAYSVAPNPATAPRTGALTIAGQTFNVTQAGMTPPASPPPVIGSGGVVNAADYTANFAPGILFAVFGTNLAPGTRTASAVPLPRSLDGVTVEVMDGTRTTSAPLVFVSPGRINAQLPFQIASSSVGVRVRTAHGVSNTVTIPVSERSPRLLTQTLDGRGQAILVHPDYTLVSSSRPAAPGDVVLVYLTGLGPVSPAIPEGAPGGDGGRGGPLNLVSEKVEVLVSGRQTTVHFAGLAPGFPGLYQINFTVPEGLRGGAADITVAVGQQESQRGVTVVCAMAAWETLATMQAGAEGATLQAAGFSLTIPPGALGAAQELQLLRAAKGTPPLESVASEVFGIAGLPAKIPEPLTVEFTATVPLVPDKTYLMVEEPGEYGGTFFLKAVVEGNRARVTLPPRQGAPPSVWATRSAKGGERLADGSKDKLVEAILLVLLTNAHETKAGAFDIMREASCVPPEAVELIAPVLTKAYDTAVKAGLAREKLEFSVFIGCYQGKLREPWGESGYASAWRGPQVDPGIKVDFSYQATMMVLGAAAEGLAKAAHLLLHAARFETSAIPAPPPSLDTAKRWLWWDEAAATFFERTVKSEAGKRPVEAMANADFALRRGLEYGSGDPGARPHGWGAYLFLESLFRRMDRDAGLLELAKIYDQRSSGDLPLETLARRGHNLRQTWLNFCEWYADFMVSEYPSSVQSSVESAEFTDLSARTISRLVTLRDLSLGLYRVHVKYKPNQTSASLRAEVTGNTDTQLLVFRVSQDGGTIRKVAGPTKLSVFMDVSGLYAARESLLVAVVNARASKPYDSVTPTLVEFKLDDPQSSPLLDQLRGAVSVSASVSAKFVCAAGSSGCPTSLVFNSDDGAYRVPLKSTPTGFTGELVQGATLSALQYWVSCSADFADQGKRLVKLVTSYRRVTLPGTAQMGEVKSEFTVSDLRHSRTEGVFHYFELCGSGVRPLVSGVTYESNQYQFRSVVTGVDWDERACMEAKVRRPD